MKSFFKWIFKKIANETTKGYLRKNRSKIGVTLGLFINVIVAFTVGPTSNMFSSWGVYNFIRAQPWVIIFLIMAGVALFMFIVNVYIRLTGKLDAWLFGYQQKLDKELVSAFKNFRYFSLDMNKYMKDKYREINYDEIIDVSIENINSAVKACYHLFENAHSPSNEMVNAENFKVTFMTRSYEDGGIMVAASYDKQFGPRTGYNVKRKNNKDYYKGTITDEVYTKYYAGESVSIKITPNVDKVEDFKKTDDKQNDEIKSHILYPICSEHDVFGTLVVHCDQENFFRTEETKYYRELLAVFVDEIRKHKLLLDIIAEKERHKPPADRRKIFWI